MNASALAGLVLMIVTETATLAGIEPFASWNTPIAWTGFILFADGIVWRARGESWIRSAPREFALLALVSIPLWLVFEFYNLFIDNWYYTGLPENVFLRQFGYAWSFATIWPAIFEGAELVAVWRGIPTRPSSTGAGASASARFPCSRAMADAPKPGEGGPPPARTDADARPRLSMASGSHGRRRSRLPILPFPPLLPFPPFPPSKVHKKATWPAIGPCRSRGFAIELRY
jgi:hypothetical protein